MARRRDGGVVGAALLLVLAGVAAAEDTKPTELLCPLCSKAANEQSAYGLKAGTTFARGAGNALLGWTELIRQPVDEVKAGGNVLTGMAHGVTRGVKRTLVGVADVLTFWVPKTKQGYLHFSTDCPLCMKRSAPSQP